MSYVDNHSSCSSVGSSSRSSSNCSSDVIVIIVMMNQAGPSVDNPIDNDVYEDPTNFFKLIIIKVII